MQKKKESNLLEKIVKKSYKNELETVLEDKIFDEVAKSLLLEILYKYETGYKDYSTVKPNSLTKEEYLENLIRIIKQECETIKIVNPNSVQNKLLEGRTFKVNKEKKEIICQPIARKLLYSISKLSKKDKIVKDKYFLLSKTISNTINVGNNINTVEPLRDFDGWSWTTVAREVESIEYNLIYQMIQILVGARFLEDWVQNKEYLIDYFDEFKSKLESNYGKKLAREFLNSLNKLSILMEIKVDKESAKEIKEQKKLMENQIAKFNNKQEYLEELTQEKNDLTQKIKQIDTTINNKELLQQEYIKRNENLPLEKKIFSMRILAEMLIKSRENTLERMEEINDLLKPKNFVNKKTELEEKLKILKIAEVQEEQKALQEELTVFQKVFLECFKEKIKKAETKQEIINLIYEYRYICLLPDTQNTKVMENSKTKGKIDEVGKQLINKATQMKIINAFANDENINYEILRNIFGVRVISLEELYLKITKEKDQFFVQLFDENAFEEKRKLNFSNSLTKKELVVKLNRKVKLFL